MDTIKNILQLVRWSNLFFLGALIYVMEKWVVVPILDDVAFGEQLPWYILLLIAAATILIAAGGYVINDYFDVKIDRINRPDDLVVTRHISRESAMHLFMALSGIGIVTGLATAWWAHSWTLLMIFVVIPGLLWFYSASYKRQLIVGNIVVAFVSALVPLLIAIANADYLNHLYGNTLAYTPIVGQLYVWLGGFAIFAFLMTFTREIVKDIEDIEGDREMECRTIPIVWGITTSKIIATILLMAIVALLAYVVIGILPFPHDWHTFSVRYVVFGIITPVLCTLALLWSANNKIEWHRIQTILKFVMFMGVMYGFVIFQNLSTL